LPPVPRRPRNDRCSRVPPTASASARSERARLSDPGWASLLVVAAAFVVEVGGRLSHAAIVARELGTPCVVGVPDVTRRLHTGDRVRIDGGTGAIERLSAASAVPAAKAPAA
jgi:hypothetical protein